MNQPEELPIPLSSIPADSGTTEASSVTSERRGAGGGIGTVAYTLPADTFARAVAGIATYAWKARTRMIDKASGEVRDEMRRVHGDVERICKSLGELEIVIKDHTGDSFDYGLPLKVIATKPVPDIPKEVVTETLKPTIYWRGHIIQHGEVEIGIPIEQEKRK